MARSSNSNRSASLQQLTAAEVRNLFPQIVGTIEGGWLFSQRVVLIDMGPRAVGIMVDGKFYACCPSFARAMAAAERADAAPVDHYEVRVRALERLGMTRSDAQGTIDAQDLAEVFS